MKAARRDAPQEFSFIGVELKPVTAHPLVDRIDALNNGVEQKRRIRRRTVTKSLRIVSEEMRRKVKIENKAFKGENVQNEEDRAKDRALRYTKEDSERRG